MTYGANMSVPEGTLAAPGSPYAQKSSHHMAATSQLLSGVNLGTESRIHHYPTSAKQLSRRVSKKSTIFTTFGPETFKEALKGTVVLKKAFNKAEPLP